MPATDDELMEVGNLLADDKIEMHLVADTGQTGGSSSGMPQFESSEGLSVYYYMRHFEHHNT